MHLLMEGTIFLAHACMTSAPPIRTMLQVGVGWGTELHSEEFFQGLQLRQSLRPALQLQLLLTLTPFYHNIVCCVQTQALT